MLTLKVNLRIYLHDRRRTWQLPKQNPLHMAECVFDESSMQGLQ
jgi:hypothetical protein